MVRYLDGTVALVTGGSRGLGKWISYSLAQAGANVMVNYAHDSKGAQKTVQWIEENGGRAVAAKADITNQEEVIQLVKMAEQEFGSSIDIIVNNATGPQPELSIEESNWKDYLDQLEFFVKAPLLLLKAVLPCMKKKMGGRIINIGSEVVQIGNPFFANYVTAKSAQIGMTRSWAAELGPYGITVNLVHPGFIPVERHEGVDPTEYQQKVPLKRMGEPADIGETVVFLASGGAKFITGQSIAVNGGNTFGT
ncbi:SDR family oxidoreductase [Heyndrickxia acidicola]|uniref:SDR family oxidoreductase n=1 Tax=Heyndrickxia acidicola TaxID=209389 RepID=A0ABU6ML76_9BACI|nr:SDR family oxidoreductase [Heyndrickxia acidicola]MED1203987.1 SDR family oxidoreductase [Heyndrickxia acidicola]